MKTAEKIINRRIQVWNGAHPNEKVKFSRILILEMAKAMTEYAEQAIDLCADVAEVEGSGNANHIVDRNSILSVKSKLS